MKNSPLNHPWGHTKIRKAEPTDPSSARPEFLGSNAEVTGVVSASASKPYSWLGADTRDLVLGCLTLVLRLMLP